MNTLHTSGPWLANGSMQGADTVISSAAKALCYTPELWNIPRDEAQANAKLMAAAPDLLEYAIAQKIADAYNSNPNGDWMMCRTALSNYGFAGALKDLHPWLGQIREAAINKATSNQ